MIVERMEACRSRVFAQIYNFVVENERNSSSQLLPLRFPVVLQQTEKIPINVIFILVLFKKIFHFNRL